MQIRMEVSDVLYKRYKELAERNGFAVTKLNQIIFEDALNDWIKEALKNEKRQEYKCIRCGSVSHNEVRVYIGTDSRNFEEEKIGSICDDCIEKWHLKW